MCSPSMPEVLSVSICACGQKNTMSDQGKKYLNQMVPDEVLYSLAHIIKKDLVKLGM